MILEFIQEEISMAEGVVIEVVGEKDITKSDQAVEEALLRSIRLIKNKDRSYNGENEDWFELLPIGMDRGYRLIFERNLISEEIFEIVVSKEAHSTLVTITCKMLETKEERGTPLVVDLSHKELKK